MPHAFSGSRALRKSVRSRKSPLRLEPLERRDLLAIITVNTVDDAIVPDTVLALREAIEVSNGTLPITSLSPQEQALVSGSLTTPNTVVFSIGTGVQTIAVQGSPLPTIISPIVINGTSQPGAGTTPRIVLDGTGAGAGADGLMITSGTSTIRGLAIRDFGGSGIVLRTLGGNTISENHIGVDSTGTVTAGNDGNGVFIDGSGGNTIGSSLASARNVIGGNSGHGILVSGASSLNNVIINNAIGSNSTGTTPLANGGDGIHISGGIGTTIGGTATSAGNTIAFNVDDGVEVAAGDGNSLRRNSIYSNGNSNDGLPIDLAAGANDGIPTPVLTSVGTRSGSTTIAGTITGAKGGRQYVVEFFSSPSQGANSTPEARTYIGTVNATTDVNGAGTINFSTTTTVAAGYFVSATITENVANNTSELSAPQQNVTTTDLVVTGSATPQPVARNGYLNYTFKVTNSGQLAAETSFTDTLPSTLSFVQVTSTQGTTSRTGQTVTAALGLLNPGASATVTILTVPTSTGSIINEGKFSAPEDPNTANNSATVTSTVELGVDLAVGVVAQPNPGINGQEVAFEYTVKNQGAATSTGSILQGSFPTTGVEFVSIATSQGAVAVDPATGVFGAQLGDIAVNASALLRVIVRAKQTGNLSSQATAKATQPEIFSENNSASITVAVNAAPVDPAEDLAPQVTRLNRYGNHKSPSSVLLGFSLPLEPETAENLANYALVTAGPDGKFSTPDDQPLHIRTAGYDSSNRQVTLTTRKPFGFHTPAQITVNGATPSGVASLSGVLLDGAFTGEPGSNFVRRFSAFGPGAIAGAQTTPLARHARRAARG